MFDVITIGGATRDIIFVTDKGKIIPTPENLTEQMLLGFEYGAKIRSEEVYFSSGGGACNTAIGLARLGLKVASFLRVGKDSDGLEIKNKLLREKVNINFIQEDKELRTGTSFIIVVKEKGNRLIFTWRGANRKLKVKNVRLWRIGQRWKKLKTPSISPLVRGRTAPSISPLVRGRTAPSISPLVRGRKRGGWIYLTSLSGDWEKSLSEINNFVKENKTELAFNPGANQIKAGKEKLAEILKSTKILFLNRDEAIELVLSCPPEPSAPANGRRIEKKQRNKNLNDPVNLIKIIRRWGPKNVVVTQGSFGAWVGNQKNIYYSPAVSKKRLDATGAGDAFGSAFLGGFILSKGDIKEALKYAIINSGNVVAYYGAQEGLLNQKEIKSRLNRVKIE